ncbi:MAG: type IX secretion system sortase PorU [Ignavibacteriaceae bacterium]
MTLSIFPQSDIKVISSGANYTVVEFRPVYSDTSVQSINNTEYRNVTFKGGVIQHSLDFGAPSILVGIINLGVPGSENITIQVMSYNFKEISGRVKPIPYPSKKDGQTVYSYTESPNYFQVSSTGAEDENIVTFGEFGISRGLGIQSFLINAVQYKPLENRIRLLESVIFRVNYPGGLYSSLASGDELLEGVVLNYQQAKQWISVKNTGLKKVNIESSKLATGKWFRFEAPEEGMYKITKAQLSTIGLDPTSLDPRTIKIYNNGGLVVPEKNSVKRHKDLVENAILVFGEEDGKFDDSDYIIFYGRGVNFWYNDTIGNKIVRGANPYSFENYFWITAGGANGKRIEKQESQNILNPINKTTSSAYVYWDQDKINIGKSGRLFLGDDFSTNVKSRTYTAKLDGYIPSQPIRYNFRLVNNSSKSVPLLVEESSTGILTATMPGFGNDDYTFGEVLETSAQYTGQLTDSRSVLKFTYSATSSSSYGYLDYYEIIYKRELKADNQPVVFYSDGESGTLEYRLYNFANSDIYAYNISDFANVKLISNPWISGGEYRFQATVTASKISKYVALLGSEYKTPKNFTEIKNQDIRGFAQGSKFIIITHKDFIEQAERLKKYRETESKVPFTTTIYTADEIYNEFSGGNRDISGIRDFIKYAYDNWETRPGYVLFFGDGDYDYRNIEGIGKNFVPTYETVNSHYELSSFCMDDFYGYVDGDDIRLDLAVGRLNVTTLSEASNVINKIIDYEQNSELGNWRNLITLVADDQTITSGYDGAQNNIQSEDLANLYIPKSFDVNKIYLVNYPTVQTSLGRRKPGVNQAIIDAINSGTLLLNFIGHGSPEVWTHEQVFVRSTTIPQMTNKNYFFLTAATCDFGYFDNPNSQSATEEMMLKANSGTIGAFTSTRPVYSYQNALLNQEFYVKLLSSERDTLNFPIPVGQAYFQTKYNFFDENDQKYTFFGDPTLRLNIPHYKASIDSINGQTSAVNIQLKALSKATLKGTVRNSENTVWQDFNGEGLLTVFDSERKVPAPEVGPDFKITMRGGIIFKGRISIINGEFSSDFIIPKDISYENKNGKIVLYIFNSSTDGVGYNSNVIIGGTDTTNIDDGHGPIIEIAFDEASNLSGYLINPNSRLIVKLSDETGLNTTGAGVGHKLQGILNEDDANPIDLTSYFSGDLDAGGKTGMVNYKFGNLQEGNHQITVKAWDVFNNYASESAYFKVVSGNNLVIDNVYNYPNPFRSNTAFTFQHNIPDAIKIRIKIYTISGRLINEIENHNSGENRFVKIEWDGRDKDGSELANGTYLYKLIVESENGQFRESVLGKLVKMN